MGGLALAHIIGVLRRTRCAIAVHDGAVGVFMIDCQNAAPLPGEERHAVVVVTHRALLTRTGAARERIKRRAVAPERIAPSRNHLPAVSFGNGHSIKTVRRNGRKLQSTACARGRGTRAEGRNTRNKSRRPRCEAYSQKMAAAQRLLTEDFKIGGLERLGADVFARFEGSPQGIEVSALWIVHFDVCDEAGRCVITSSILTERGAAHCWSRGRSI